MAHPKCPLNFHGKERYKKSRTCKRCAMLYSLDWNVANPEKVKRYLKAFRQCHPNATCVQRQKARQRAFTKIAKQWGDNTPRCRIDLTPNSPVSDFPCRGKLQIDHLKGGGNEERKRGRGRSGLRLYYDILAGRRSVMDLRVLCQLHQLWNQIEPIPQQTLK